MRTLFTSLALASAIAAQPAPHTTTIPTVGTGTFLGSTSSFPLGRTGGKAQYWFRGDQLPGPMAVTSIGPRPGSNVANSTPRTQSLEITMANTSLAHAAFGRVFTQNLGASPTVVYARKMLSIPAFPAHTNVDAPGVWIALDAPFPLIGPNLVIDFDLGSAVGAVSAPYNGDLLNLAAAGRHMTSDPSCGGTLAASSTTTSYTLNMAGATPSGPAWFFVSTNPLTLGGLALPVKLDPIGMPGCLLSVDPQIIVTSTANASGVATLTAPIAIGDAVALYAQGAHASSANPFGLATTNVTRSILGGTAFCSYIYNFTVDGPSAQNGPNNWQGALLLQ